MEDRFEIVEIGEKKKAKLIGDKESGYFIPIGNIEILCKILNYVNEGKDITNLVSMKVK